MLLRFGHVSHQWIVALEEEHEDETAAERMKIMGILFCCLDFLIGN